MMIISTATMMTLPVNYREVLCCAGHFDNGAIMVDDDVAMMMMMTIDEIFRHPHPVHACSCRNATIATSRS